MTLKDFFSQIESSYPYRFTYIESQLPKANDISVSANSQDIESLLKSILAPKGLVFVRIDNNFAIKVAKSEPSTIVIKGTVRDNDGVTIIGATVIEKGSHNGTTTDTNGEFSIEANKDAILTVEYLGYESLSIAVSNRKEIHLTMTEDTEIIDEVVVVGYGTQSSKLVTSSIGKVKLDDVDRGSDSDPVKMLQGRVAGVSISSSAGTPGSSPNVLVRGVGSISGGSSPLYVVDGIPSEKYPNINPGDVESMEVLKDASAAAIYGSRANAGVVIITTKSGKSGKTVIEASGQIGIGTLLSSNDIEMANTQEYLQVMRAAVDNYNTQMGTSLKLYEPTNMVDTDWVDEISRDYSISTQASVSMSGGNDKTTFFTSFGLNTQEGYLEKSNYEQYNVRAKFGHKINDIFKVNINLSGAVSFYDMVEEESTSLKVLRSAREEQPWADPYQEDGSYAYNGGTLVRHNPIMLINEEDWTLNKYQGSGVFSIDVTPFKGFKYSPSVSLYGIFDDEEKKLTEDNDARAASWAAIAQQKDVSFRYVIDNIISYNNEYDKLTYSLLLGHSFESYQYERFGAESDTYANGAFPSSSFGLINAGSDIYAGTFSYSAYALESYFSRVALNWDNRYVFNSTVRIDGSSRFSEGNRYGVFPSASFAWLLSNEKFYVKNDVLDEAKLRLSWGKTGSMAGVGNFDTQSLVSASGNSYNGQAGFQISQDGQPLEWEKANQINVGFDLGFFNSRMHFVADAFYQKTTDLLYEQPVVSTTGYSSLQSNIGSLQNRGIELALSGTVIKKQDFTWDLSANISFVDSKLLSLIDGLDMIVVAAENSNLIGGEMHALITGQPISTWYMYEMEGIYQYDDEVPTALYNKGVRAGDVKYKDVDGDGDISEADRLNVGKATPDYYGGITSTMRYKGFDLNLFAQFSVGGSIMAAWKGVNGVEGTEHLGLAVGNTVIDGTTYEQFFNVSKEAATEYWRGPGTSNTMPRAVRIGVHSGYSYDYNTLTSTRYLEDASYLRLKTITLGYTLPEKMVSKWNIQSLRVYFSADNPWLITGYSGYDPECSYDSNPGDTHYGVDFGLQPSLTTYLFGLNIKL